MQDEKLNDVTWLYDFALDWYSKHPGEQISLYDWQNKVEQANELSDPLVIYAGLNSIKPVSHNIIPALAAIELGVDTETLIAIIKHHEVICYHVTQTVCQPIYDDDYVIENEESIAEIVNQAFVDAFMSDNILAQSFAVEYTMYGVSYGMEMAWLLCDHAPFWPDTLVSLHIEKIAQGKQVRAKVPSVISAYAFEDSPIKLTDFSSDRIISMLKRSGNLRLGLTTENGFAANNINAFFRTLLAIDPKKNQNINKVFEVINNLQDKELISLINSKIIENLSDRNSDIESGAKLFSYTNELLSNDLYGSINKDLVLNLKLLKNDEMSGNAELPIYDYYGNHLATDLGHSPGLAIDQLLSDLKALKPEEFRRPHFEAIGILLSNCAKLDEPAKKNCRDLLFVALNGLDAYRVTPHYHVANATTDVHVEAANRGLERLIRLVASSYEINYSDFSKYSSGSKALLASHGFDIKKLPGISRRDRGQVLYDGMGL